MLADALGVLCLLLVLAALVWLWPHAKVKWPPKPLSPGLADWLNALPPPVPNCRCSLGATEAFLAEVRFVRMAIRALQPRPTGMQAAELALFGGVSLGYALEILGRRPEFYEARIADQSRALAWRLKPEQLPEDAAEMYSDLPPLYRQNIEAIETWRGRLDLSVLHSILRQNLLLRADPSLQNGMQVAAPRFLGRVIGRAWPRLLPQSALSVLSRFNPAVRGRQVQRLAPVRSRSDHFTPARECR